MTILDTIKTHKIKEVAHKKTLHPIAELEKSPLFDRNVISFKEAIIHPEKNGIIAEFKRKSPSKGIINNTADPITVTSGYEKAGVSAISVLTDVDFFGANTSDFELARKTVNSPILRKDFILDEYQILESKAMGADVILLIAKMITPSEIERLSHFAKSLGLEVFLETHSEKEILDTLSIHVDAIGINNRNLNSFEVDVENSIRLAQLIPSHCVKIAESGIDSVQTFKTLKNNGFDGFLMGEYFMKHSIPEEKCREFIQSLTL
jgi:indole-3-glycerol phosphate synthase